MPRQGWLLVGLGASVLLLLYQNKQGIMNMGIPRGIRNNNAGNIRHGSSKWKGMAQNQTDSAFVQFVSPEYGIRALSHVLDSYARRGANTVRKIIDIYAPPVENDTSAYVDSVALALGVGADQIINVQTHKADLVEAIIQHENGQQPYAVSQIASGVLMA